MNNKTQLKRASNCGVIFYSFGDLASQFVWTFIGSYLTVFYTDIVGLAPAAAAAIMMIARVWDAVNDPMMGAIAERTRSKFGRFRPYILFGSPLLAIFSVLCFTHPFAGSSKAGVIYAAVTYIITGMLYTLVNIPYGALAAVMTEDAEQRNKINASRNVGMNVGILIVNGITANVMLFFSGKGAEVANGNGYFMTALVYAIISIPCFLAVFFTSKEQVVPEVTKEKFSLKMTITGLVTNKNLMILLVIMILQMAAWMGRIGVVIYYIMYCLGSFTLIPVIMLAPSVCGIVSSLMVPKVMSKFGKRMTLQIAVTCQGIALLAMYFTPFDNLTLIIIESGLVGFFNVSFPCSLSLLGDAIDYNEYKTGMRNDGIAYATYGLAQKLGNAIGASVGVLLLASFGYVANAQQTPETLHGINIVVNLIPAIIFFLTAIFAFTWRLKDSEADEVRAKLHERKNKENIE
jgi:sugar (glycoside-pentoside-hexuronide) transporter